MPGASDTPPSPAEAPPSLFLSYSSEDRAAARLLRDGLEAAGLEVWYDESELGGGDAWDQKIRRQIRECHFFLPLISASTERRSEGYFRREWKLAVERTHDMADDVMFLVPVVIDDTRDATARVPEKFLSVQWQRIPGGRPGPALTALAARLLRGETTPLARTPPRSAGSRPAASVSAEGPPPMPPFPEKATDGHQLHFYAQVLWWVITAGWLIFKRFPRWVRFILVLMLLTSLFKCSPSKDESEDNSAPKHPPKTLSPASQEAIKQAAIAARQKLGKDGADKASVSELVRAGAQIADTIATELDKEKLVPGQIGIVEFGSGFKGTSREAVEATCTALFGQLAIARPDLIKPLEAALAGGTDHDLLAAAAKAGDSYVVVTGRELTDGEEFLTVRLIQTTDGAVPWSGRYAVAYLKDPAALKKLSQAILGATPKG
ncbi:MAG: toll/interleukin-1 receptor domain-containing protein [Opitutales bacterium]